jgi:hypothetical protein
MQFPRPLDRVFPQLPSYIKEHPWFFLLYSYYVNFQSFILSFTIVSLLSLRMVI